MPPLFLFALLWTVPVALADVSHETIMRLAQVTPTVKHHPSEPWIDHAPTVAQVFKDIQGTDQIDTTARQAAVFEILRNSIQTWTGVLDIRRMSPDAVVKFQEYSRAFGEKPYGLKLNDGACVGDACIRKQFYDKQYRYSTDPKFTREALARYFPKEYVEVQVASQIAVQTPPKPVTRPGESSWDSFNITMATLIIGGPIILIILLVWWIVTRPKTPEEEFIPPISDTYGTAQWAEHQLNPSSPSAVSSGVMFGKSSRPDLPADAPGAPITSIPETHTLIVARTRTGKGTCVIVPTLLRYNGSMFIIDPKGEDAAITARTRRDQLGQSVHIINPWGVLESHYKEIGFTPATFNPLDAIDRNDLNAVAVARSLAAIICPASKNSKDSFWQNSAANVVTGVLLWLADEPGEQKTLARARDIFTMGHKDFQAILTKMVTSTAYHGAIKEMLRRYIDLARETYDGILANLDENTAFLSDPRVKAATKSSSFSMENLRDERMTIFLVIPHDRIKTDAAWLKLMIAAAMQGLKNRSRIYKTPPRHRCMFLIDEFGSMGYLANIPSDIAVMSGYGLDFTLIVQGLDQLKYHYEDASNTILSNCGYKWFCNIIDLDSAKYLSESLGKATVRTVGKSKSSGQSGQKATEGESTTYGETGRLLLTPDEILNLGKQIAILLNPFDAPYYLRPVEYMDLSQAFAHLKDEYPQMYWDPPLSYDRNPEWQDPMGGRSKEDARSQARQSSEAMTDKKARQILGVKADAKPEEIRAAYTRLMKGVHPDMGGSHYLAVQINAAKAFLLGE